MVQHKYISGFNSANITDIITEREIFKNMKVILLSFSNTENLNLYIYHG